MLDDVAGALLHEEFLMVVVVMLDVGEAILIYWD
jgi:hypothetical protein